MPRLVLAPLVMLAVLASGACSSDSDSELGSTTENAAGTEACLELGSVLSQFVDDSDSLAAEMTPEEMDHLFDAAEGGVPSDIDDEFHLAREFVGDDLEFKRAYADAAVPGELISEAQEQLALERFQNIKPVGGAVRAVLVWTADCGESSDSEKAVSIDGVPLADALEPVDTNVSFEFSTGPRPGEAGLPFAAGTTIAGGRVIGVEKLRTDWSQPAIIAAACRNYRYWLDDVTLDTSVVILNDPGLYRSAELLDGDYRDSTIALSTEQRSVEGESLDSSISLLDAEGASDQELEEARRYFEDRSMPPSDDVRSRYVVYVSSVTLRSVTVTRLAIEPEREKIEPPVSRILTMDVVVNPSEWVEVPEETCWTT